MIPLLFTVNNTSPPGSGSKNTPAASIGPFTKPDGGIQYGVQAPNIQTQSLQLVIDGDYRAYGPAWHFQGSYDKVVILDENDFAAGASVSKRQEPGPPKGGDKNGFRHRFQVLPGDFPWFCIFNSTFIEGYIYVTDNSTAATSTNAPAAWPSSNPLVSSDSGAPHTTPATAAASTTSPGGPRPTSSRAVKARGDGDYPSLPQYPRIIKIEERRLPNSPQPYCQKMQLLESGALVPARNSNQQPLRIQLQETDPSMDDFRIAAAQPPSGDATSSASSSSPTGRGKRTILDKRRDPGSACHCQWMFQ